MKRHINSCVTLLAMVALLSLSSVGGEGVTAISQTCVPAPSDLVSWWPGDGDAIDIVGGNDGTLQNGATFAAGMVGQAFSFDGINDLVSVPHNANLNPGTGDFTVDFWMKTTTSGVERAVLSKRPFCAHTSFWSIAMTAPGCCFIPGVQDGRLITELDQDGAGTNYNQIVSTISVNDGVWHHIAFVRQGTTATLYIDGMVQGSVSTGGVTNVANATDLLFGDDPCGRQTYLGELDEIEYFNRALSASEIEDIFLAGSAGKCKDDDGDGIPDDQDQCADSDLSPTVVIDGCNSGVPNTVLSTGCTISDLIDQCAANASDHDEFVSCVSQLTNELQSAGMITGRQKGAIQRCAAQADIP